MIKLLRFRFCQVQNAAAKGFLTEKGQREIAIDRLSMTPHQYWIAMGKGMERPYTGEYWFNQEVGYYHCAHCEQKLFSFENKYKSQTGYASFWNHLKNSVIIEENNHKVRQNNNQDQRDVKCNCCKCFIGKVHFDGPPPTFIRYQINSAALKFHLKPWFEDPNKIHAKVPKQERNYLEEAQKGK